MTRRTFLGALSAGAVAGLVPASESASRGSASRPKVAAVFTAFTYRSHAHVLLENFLEPYWFNGERTDSGMDVVSFYADQRPSGDMASDVADRYGIRIFPTIEEALCLGGRTVAVDAVLSIGEHGSYPVNPLGQTEYPRKRFFDEIADCMRRSNRVAPVFSDKHLSYDWKFAKSMYDTARELGIPLMAGSSVPLAQRIPPMDLPTAAGIEEAVAVHGGPIESYDFHGLEILQSLVEARAGGESGVEAIEFLDANALARDKSGVWRDLAERALAAELGTPPPDWHHIAGEEPVEPHAIRIHYRDGLRATVLKVGTNSTRWSFACRLKGDSEPIATRFYVGPWENRNLFKALAHAVQHHFVHREPPYPIERTLLTTGMLEASMRSRHAQGERIATPHLELTYQPRDFSAMREMGASWRIITEDIPQPPGIDSARPSR